MFSLQSDKYKTAHERLKMSLVPVPCQESQLNPEGSTCSESIEWLLDLKNKIPVWSRLCDINTSGFLRQLPLSMTQNYDIEVEGRLWSLWGSKRRLKNQNKFSKSFMAITVMALCTARIMSLNTWNTKLMDIIRDNGRLYFKESIKNVKGSCKDFQLTDLLTECHMAGIRFSVHFKTKQKGFLYTTPSDCHTNLALALIRFFERQQFGILECCQRLLGFGYIDGPQGGYFMYDAQSFNKPIFPQNSSANYLLRTNHLQVLLYCLVVALNVWRLDVCFCLHHVDIKIENPYKSEITNEMQLNNSIAQQPNIRATEIWKNADKQSESVTNVLQRKELMKPESTNDENKTHYESAFRKKYRRKIHNIKAEKVEQSLIKPLVDADYKSDEDLHLKKEFVRMVCSDTVLPLTTADLPQKTVKEFSCNLLDALLMGPRACLMFKEL